VPTLAWPSRPRTEDVARITVVQGNSVSVLYPRRDDALIGIVSRLGFHWDGQAWHRDLNGQTGTPADRAAEAGRALLAGGFPVEFPDEATRDAAVTGTFTPEQRRWIRPAAGRFPGWLAITWPGRDEALYQAASSLPGARYDGDAHHVAIPPEQYRAILSFARKRDFGMTPEAAALLAAARSRAETAVVIDPAKLAPVRMPAAERPSLDKLPAVDPENVPALPIARPVNALTETRAVISYSGQEVAVRFPEDRNDFRNAMRSLRFRWDAGAWRRTIGELAGRVEDRVAETGRRLLASGFVVHFPDEAALRAAVDGTYTPEQLRWVLPGQGQYEGWFSLRWFRPADDWTRANLLTGARYDPDTRTVVVPPEHCIEVEDFAETHGYNWHWAARDTLARARLQQETVLDVRLDMVAPPAEEQTRRPNGVTSTASFLDFPAHDFELRTDLLPHQVPAVAKVLPLRVGALFMEQGLGKTRCAIELAHARRFRLSRVVWFCPVTLKPTIAAEIHKHAGETAYIFDETTNCETLPRDRFWYVAGIESMSAGNRAILAANSLIDENTFVVVDESSYIKGHAAKRTRRITTMAERARYRLVLTGTPMTQGVVDLYAQMRFLSPDILAYPSFYSFARNHLEYHPDYPGMIVRSHQTDLLAAKIAPFVYQVTKDEAGIDLPAKLYDARYFGMTWQQRTWYENVKEEILESAEEFDSYVIFRLFTALQRIASGFHREAGRLVEIPHVRLDVLLDNVQALPAGEPVIVWCKYVYSVEAVAAALRDLGDVALYYGKLSQAERAAELTRFQNGARFLIATQATGGHGLTLNEAAYAIFYENGFKYSERIQAEDRNHRLGQTRRPTYIDLVCQCGIEQRIQDALARKANVVSLFKREVAGVQDRAKIKELL
jgi:rhodanese-related sulfurtransferase